MVKKIISGGETGAERAALDVAVELDIPYSGWIPQGRKTEDPLLPPRYQLREIPDEGYGKGQEQNVIDSEGTLILSHGDLTGYSAFTRQVAEKRGRPWIHIDFSNRSAFSSAQLVNAWIIKYGIEIVHITGSDSSEDPDIYDAAQRFLKAVIALNMVTTSFPTNQTATDKWPNTVSEAIDRLIVQMSLKDKTAIARMEKGELHYLIQLDRYIKNTFGLGSGNEALIQSCSREVRNPDLTEDSAAGVIMEELWKRLRETHVLRIIK